MRSKVALVAAMLVGSFAVYCSQSMMNGDGPGAGDGFVKDAKGDACCTAPAPSFVKIADGDISLAAGKLTFTSQPIATGPYKEIIIYVSGTPAKGICTEGTGTTVQFRPDANTPFGDTGTGISDMVRGSGSRIRVDGSDMRLVLTLVPNGANCTSATLHYTVAGVS